MAVLNRKPIAGATFARLHRTDQNIPRLGRVSFPIIAVLVCVVLHNLTWPPVLNAQAANALGVITAPQIQGLEELPAPAVPGPTEKPMQVHGSQNRNQAAFAPPLDSSVRIIDVVSIEGEMENDVQGIGLVTGLSQTGGKSLLTRSMAKNFFLAHRLPVDKIDTKNMSAVTISGLIPPHTRVGEWISVTVATADDAISLYGGTLQRSVLRGIDNQVYAVASGAIVAGGLAAGGAAAGVQKDHPTAGTCQAEIVRAICPNRLQSRYKIGLLLRNKEYLTAVRIANEINKYFPHSARALDPGAVEVIVPETFQNNSPAFISMIGELRIIPSTRARVVINQKTGTIVMGEHVRISKVLFTNENLVIGTTETPLVVQPAPFSGGRTTVVPRTQIQVFESGGTYNVVNEGVTVGELANALNTLQVPPSDLIQLFRSLERSGALQAELIIE